MQLMQSAHAKHVTSKTPAIIVQKKQALPGLRRTITADSNLHWTGDA